MDQRDRTQKELSNELNLAFERIDALQSRMLLLHQQITGNHLAEVLLRWRLIPSEKELDQANVQTFDNSNANTEISQIQDELRNAVAQSFELQMELEQTQAK